MNDRIEEFLAYLLKERSLSPNTVAAYRNDLLQFADNLEARAAIEGTPNFALSTIDRERLNRYFLHLRDRGYSAASIARKMAAVRSFFQYLHRKGELASDPTDGIGSPEVKKPLPRTASEKDVATLLAFCARRDTPEGLRDHAMLRLLWATGMRVGELVTLNVSDINLHTGKVRVVGRGNRERHLPLDSATIDSLRTYLGESRPFMARNAPTETALVVNQRGLRLTRQGFWLIMKGIVRDAGLPLMITPHTLRHSFATQQIGEGLGLEELRQLLGHASIATTQIYSQLAGQSPERGGNIAGVTSSLPRTAQSSSSLAERADEAAHVIRARNGVPPSVAVILGSGLGDLADEIEAPVVVPYAEIPHFPVSTVAGHAGQLVIGTLQGTPIVAMRGRVHYYEGYSLRDVTFPVRVMRRLGAQTLIVTNAAGGLNETFRTGDLMVLTDHLNLMGMAGFNPLLGTHEPELGVRFLDMLQAYDPELRALAHQVARQNGFAIQEGVYAMVAGPNYETLAEIRFLQRGGADAVGMSTIPETIVARHEHMRVLGISAITDMAVGAGATLEISHADVLAAAEQIKPRLAAVVRGVLAALA